MTATPGPKGTLLLGNLREWLLHALGPRLRRVCIGNTFALNELVLVMATIARQGHLRLASARAIAPRPLITLRPAEPINARFLPGSAST